VKIEKLSPQPLKRHAFTLSFLLSIRT